MANDEFSDADLESLGYTEEHERYRALDSLQREKQLSLPSLDRLSDAELVYLAGHRDWVESEHDHISAGDQAAVARETLGTQQKVRGNAWRAKDLLDHRLANRQVDALEESNTALKASNDVVAASSLHMKATADATRHLVRATIALVVVTLAVGLVTLFRRPDITVRPLEAPPSTTIVTTTTVQRNHLTPPTAKSTP